MSIVSFAVADCTSIKMENDSNYYIGIVKVDKTTQSNGSATRVRTLGIYAGDHNGIGYIDEFKATMGKDCSVLLIVPDAKTAETFSKEINKSLGEVTCIFEGSIQD